MCKVHCQLFTEKTAPGCYPEGAGEPVFPAIKIPTPSGEVFAGSKGNVLQAIIFG
jgi:hypothetical protein